MLSPGSAPDERPTAAVGRRADGSLAVAPPPDAPPPAPAELPVAVPDDAIVTGQPAWQVQVEAGWSALGRGDAEGAEARFREAIALNRLHAEARLGLGQALVAQGEPRNAADELCEARRLDQSLNERVARILESHDLICGR